jgi:phenylacetate-coenzyme A ligase PaaK-like adenylate-forming protein
MGEMNFWEIRNKQDFDRLAIETFRFQADNNPVYRHYLELLSIDPMDRLKVSDIPFLPVEFFKSHRVVAGNRVEDAIFHSSGTTGMESSRHYVADIEFYVKSFVEGFRNFYGDPGDYCFLALLPSYLERGNSSLVFMMDRLIRMSRYPYSGFYLNELKKLHNTLIKTESLRIPVILLGVSYALLDLADRYSMELKYTTIVETGGMKGKRQELPKQELHRILTEAFGVAGIHSEYGMTELLSQAWSKGGGIFQPPPWMQVVIRDPYDPFSFFGKGRTGGINVIDLANRYSCSFIETQDLGRLHSGNSFEVIGRFDNSDIRGCNLLVQ